MESIINRLNTLKDWAENPHSAKFADYDAVWSIEELIKEVGNVSR